MKKNKWIALMTVFCLVSFVSKAQDEDQAEVAKFVKEFQQDVVQLRMEGFNSKDHVTKYLTSDFTLRGTTVNIKNLVSNDFLNYDQTMMLLNQMRKTDLTLKRTIRELKDINVRGNLAFVRYTNDYEWLEGERLINKGVQHVQLLLKKSPQGAWQVSSMNYVELDDEKYKGMCISSIYENKNRRDIITQTYVPNGTEMEEFQDKFTIDNANEPKRVVYGFNDYLWTNKGALSKRNKDGSAGEQLGLAKDLDSMIKLLLTKEVYPDQCFTITQLLK